MRRYIGIFFTLRGPVFSWDSPIFAYLTSFYRINDARHLWSNLQKCEFSFWEKEYDCNKCKTTFKFFFSRFWVFFDAFLSFFNELMLRILNLKKICILYILMVYYLKRALKSQNTLRNTLRNKIFWLIEPWADGAQHQKKTDDFGIKVPFSLTSRIRNTSKIHNLYLHQSKITLPGLLWNTLYYDFWAPRSCQVYQH